MGYNKKYWHNQYNNKNNIINWYKNFITYYPEEPPKFQSKFEFLKGELKEIKTIFKNKKEQKQIFDFIKNIILKEE